MHGTQVRGGLRARPRLRTARPHLEHPPAPGPPLRRLLRLQPAAQQQHHHQLPVHPVLQQRHHAPRGRHRLLRPLRLRRPHVFRQALRHRRTQKETRQTQRLLQQIQFQRHLHQQVHIGRSTDRLFLDREDSRRDIRLVHQRALRGPEETQTRVPEHQTAGAPRGRRTTHPRLLLPQQRRVAGQLGETELAGAGAQGGHHRLGRAPRRRRAEELLGRRQRALGQHPPLGLGRVLPALEDGLDAAPGRGARPWLQLQPDLQRAFWPLGEHARAHRLPGVGGALRARSRARGPRVQPRPARRLLRLRRLRRRPARRPQPRALLLRVHDPRVDQVRQTCRLSARRWIQHQVFGAR